ncbi:MAG: hypothetical protein B6240_03640 [Desulfobacteraceae bacterium 4572_87]|nr:MAG: hypothetical protein B6240_03640 [Desulfobacteraceae bacterium 4572_87]
MKSQKLTNMLSIVSNRLFQEEIPFCLIGAMALGVYGLPRYTSDIDLLAEKRHWPKIDSLMKKLGYECYQESDFFAQFDSELGVYGKVDFMFVNTEDGRNILERRVLVEDDIFGRISVIQPSDYIILKLMAIANNPHRSIKDESDLSVLLDLHANNLLSEYFEVLDVDRILLFADRFGLKELIAKYLSINTPSEGPHRL